MNTSHLATSANLGGALQPRHSARHTPVKKISCFRPGRLGACLRRLMLTGFCFVSAAHAFSAPAVTLAWNANPETDIARYKLSYGTTSGVYPNVIDVGLNTQASVTGLVDGTGYFFTVSAINAAGVQSPNSSEVSYVTGNPVILPSNTWTLNYVDSEELQGYAAVYAFDGDPNTFWHTEWRLNAPPPPHEIQINLGSRQSIDGFRYLPRQDGYSYGNVGQFEFYVSVDGVTWGSPVATGVFPNTRDPKEIRFAATSCQYIRLRGLTDATGGPYMSVAELGVIQAAVPPVTNQAPIASPKSLTMPEDTSLALSLQGTDADGGTLGFSVVSAPANGILSGTAPNLTYTPFANYNGTDSFAFLVNDGTINSASATVSITVNGVNDAPVALSKSVTTAEGSPLPIMLAGIDVEGSPLTFTLVGGPANGTLGGTAPNLTYQPAASFSGSDAFTFRVNDGTLDSAPATVFITVTAVNFAPVFSANPINLTATEDESFAGQLLATDVDAGDVLNFQKISGPDWLTVFADGKLGGTPLNSNVGTGSFIVSVSDPSNASATATLSITVSNINDAPVFKLNPLIYPAGTEKALYLDQSLASSATDSDAGDTISYSKVAGPAWLVIAKSGALSGTPPSGSAGTNLFTIRATDAAGALTETSLQIKINANTLPLPWDLDRVGSANIAGAATYSAGIFTVAGAGILANTADSGNFAWQTLSGDGSIIARVTKLSNTGTAARVGVMIRESLATNSRQIYMGVDGSGDYQWLRRLTTAGSTAKNTRAGQISTDIWVRLVRTLNVVTAYQSTTGTSWTKIGRCTVTLPSNCYIGLWVSSGDNQLLNSSQFGSVVVVP